MSDRGILNLLSAKDNYGEREDFVHSQSDVARLSGSGLTRVNRLANQVRTREDNLRVSKRREIEIRKGRLLTVQEIKILDELLVQRLEKESIKNAMSSPEAFAERQRELEKRFEAREYKSYLRRG